MTVSPKGLALLREFEGLRLNAYPDPASGGDPWTIGYGHTKGVKKGDVITEEQANLFLWEDAAEAEEAITDLVVVPLSQGQRDALVSFIFNLGRGNFQRSTLLRKLNSGDYKGAADEFLRWNKAAGKVMPGLTRRRKAERELFLSETQLQPVQEKPMAPFLAAAIPALIEVVPNLVKIFGSGSEVSERNAKAAEIVVNAAKEAIGAKNEQELIEQIHNADPETLADIRAAVKEVWYEIAIDTTGVEGARKANSETKEFWVQPAFWVTVLLLPLVYGVVYAVLYLPGFTDEVKAMVVASVVSGLLGSIAGFWLGTSWSSSRKTDALTKK